jgi:hypothetical protein
MSQLTSDPVRRVFSPGTAPDVRSELAGWAGRQAPTAAGPGGDDERLVAAKERA